MESILAFANLVVQHNRARATTAAPRYFKSFHHQPSHKIYIDGAILHNNPVRIADSERRILWPHHHVPDLLLSIGTGSSPTLVRSESEHLKAIRKGIFSHGRHLYDIMRNSLDQTLNCEKVWNDYFAGVITSLAGLDSTSRFIRINPNVGEIPGLDEKEKMGSLRMKAHQALGLELNPQVNQIAMRLIASSFYFELSSAPELRIDDTDNIHGRICCRLLQPSNEMREFGKHIRSRAENNEHLQFAVQDGDMNTSALLPLTTKTMDFMIREGVFIIDPLNFQLRNRLLPTQINLCFGQTQMCPISGFPRLIIQEDEHPASSFEELQYSTLEPVSNRYIHGSQHLKGLDSEWRPPDIQGASSLSNLREYVTNPERALGYGLRVPGGTQLQTRSSEQLEPAVQVRLIPSREVSQGKVGLRGVFKALVWPLRSLKTEENQKGSTNRESLPSGLEEWLQEYRKTMNKPSEHERAFREISEEVIASLRNCNIKPAEYAVYERWINLLQQETLTAPSSTTSFGPNATAKPQPTGDVYELGDTSVIPELMDTSRLAERNSWEIPIDSD